MARLLTYDQGEFSFLETGLREDVRWITWKPDGKSALLVGNSGLAAWFRDGVIRDVPSGTRMNLRGAAFSPHDDRAIIVGNNGVMMEYSDQTMRRIESGVVAHLRRVAWSPDGRNALIVGNDGICARLDADRSVQVRGAVSNLRAVEYQPTRNFALVCANRFSGEFVPSPNLFRYTNENQTLEPLLDGENSDLTALAWHPGGDKAIVVGYDLTWHEPRLFETDGKEVSKIESKIRGLHPSAVSWLSEHKEALIGTATPEAEHFPSQVLIMSDGRLERIFEATDYHVTCIACHPAKDFALIAGSPATRIFNA